MRHNAFVLFSGRNDCRDISKKLTVIALFYIPALRSALYGKKIADPD
jgi:hypothetical protein